VVGVVPEGLEPMAILTCHVMVEMAGRLVFPGHQLGMLVEVVVVIIVLIYQLVPAG
jgi:hypothetical protein